MTTYPSDAAILAIFDFKGILEAAIATVFVNAGFGATQTINSTTITDFQSKMPRVEIKVTIGEGGLNGYGLVQGIRICATYKASMEVRTVTRVTDDQKQSHAMYRAKAFFLCNILGRLVNNQPGGLTLHKLNDPVRQTSTSDVSRTTDGFEFSEQNFNFDFSVLNNAWNSLNALTAT